MHGIIWKIEVSFTNCLKNLQGIYGIIGVR